MAPPVTTPILRTEGLPPTVWRNAWVHGGSGNGPMHSVALVNYDGNASTNVLKPVAVPFNLTLRCTDGAGVGARVHGGVASRESSTQSEDPLNCSSITNAVIVVFGGATTSLLLTKTTEVAPNGAAPYTMLHTHVPANTIQSALAVVVFSADGELTLREAAAQARKALERLRVSVRTTGLTPTARARWTSTLVAQAGVALHRVQDGVVTAEMLSAGPTGFKSLQHQLEGAVTNITKSVSAAAEQSRATTVAAASAALLALAAAPPAPQGNRRDRANRGKHANRANLCQWRALSATVLWNASTGYGWVLPINSTRGRSVIDSPETTGAPGTGAVGGVDALHGRFIGGGPQPSTFRLDVPGSATRGVVTIVTGSFDTSRLSASTAIRVQGAVEGGSLLLPGGYDYSGSFRHVSFRFTCNTTGTSNNGTSGRAHRTLRGSSNTLALGDRTLLLTFGSDAAGNFYGDGYGQGTHNYVFAINAILVQEGT